MTSRVAKHSDASKMQHNDTIVGMQIALTSETDELLNLQVSAFWTLMTEPFSSLDHHSIEQQRPKRSVTLSRAC